MIFIANITTFVPYRAGSLVTVAKYNLDLMGVHKVRWEGGGTEPGGETIFYGKGNKNHELGTGCALERSLGPWHCSERSCCNRG
jgi:hypothetical protein